MRSRENRRSSRPTVASPRNTPTPPAPINHENEPTPVPNRSRNTTNASTNTRPWPIWSTAIEVIGAIARGVRTMCVIPSTNSNPTRRS